LGACSYQRSFIPRYADIAEPVTEMLRKGTKIEPTERRVKSFNALKQALVSSPILALPIDEPEYESGWVLDCDASLVAAAAILQQWQDVKLRAVEYASSIFNAAERNWCASRREMAALLFGLEHFRRYLLGRKFVVRVDNTAITHFRTTPEPTAQVARSLAFLEEFDFSIIHRPGDKSANVDSLSRIRQCELQNGEACKQCNRRITGRYVLTVQARAQWKQSANSPDLVSEDRTAVDRQTLHEALPNACGRSASRRPEDKGEIGNAKPTVMAKNISKKRSAKANEHIGILGRVAPMAVAAGTESWSPEYIAQQQAQDGDIALVFEWIANGRPDWSAIKSSSPALRALFQQFESVIVRDGCLYRIFHNSDGSTDYLQLILPHSMKIPFLELIYASAAGHLKTDKCIYHVMRRAWWYNFKRDV
jgi:hypothetical protein